MPALPVRPEQRKIALHGYIGSLNTAKLHPQVMDFIDAVDDKHFSLAFYGDADVSMPLADTKRTRLMGYTQQPVLALQEMDIFSSTCCKPNALRHDGKRAA